MSSATTSSIFLKHYVYKNEPSKDSVHSPRIIGLPSVDFGFELQGPLAVLKDPCKSLGHSFLPCVHHLPVNKLSPKVSTSIIKRVKITRGKVHINIVESLLIRITY